MKCTLFNSMPWPWSWSRLNYTFEWALDLLNSIQSIALTFFVHIFTLNRLRESFFSFNRRVQNLSSSFWPETCCTFDETVEKKAKGEKKSQLLKNIPTICLVLSFYRQLQKLARSFCKINISVIQWQHLTSKLPISHFDGELVYGALKSASRSPPLNS